MSHNTNPLTQTIGVAGCGSMGLPMAVCLQRDGFAVLGHDVRSAAEYADSGIDMVEDPVEFSSRTDILISVVRDVQQTRDLLFGEQNVTGQTSPPSTVVISSTVSPRFILELRQQLPAHVALMDAPMSGAPYRARDGELSFMLGGDEQLIDRLLPIFGCMGSKVFRLGGLSTGMTAKVLNNYCAATGLIATRRVLEMAHNLSLDPRKLLDVMKESSGSNWYGDHIDEIDWSRQGYDPANTIGIVEKDVRSALDAVADSEGLADCRLDEALLDGLRKLEPLKLPDRD